MEDEQKALIASRSKMRAAQRAAEREMQNVAEATRSLSQLSHASSSSNGLMKPKASSNSIPNRSEISTPLKSSIRYLKPVRSPQSNRQIIKNALLHVCLAGTVNEKIKKDVLEVCRRIWLSSINILKI